MLAALVGGCVSAEFSTSDQRRGYGLARDGMATLQRQYVEQASNVDLMSGLLIIFDIENDNAVPKFVVSGDTDKVAMERLLGNERAPCTTTSGQERVAGYAPPKSVSLPISFQRCSDLLARVIFEKTTRSDLQRLLVFYTEQMRLNNLLAANVSALTQVGSHNSSDLNRLSKSLSRIADVQQTSWLATNTTLNDMIELLKSHN